MSSIEAGGGGLHLTRPHRSLRYVAARLPGYLRDKLLGSVLLLPYGRFRHRRLRGVADRRTDHTYTTFLRSPPQLEALTGPVLDYLRLPNGLEPLRISVFACSTGAEAYTVASELARRRPDMRRVIQASDLHAHTVEQARRGIYSHKELAEGPGLPGAFVANTFDRVGADWSVKEEIRTGITFETLNLLDEGLATRVAPADIVFLQNVLFHLPPELARRAFTAAIATLKPRSVLFVDGMELDMRVELTRAAGLRPLPYRIREVYEYSRRHIAWNWWDYYYGNEPYYGLARDRDRRYGTIFLKGE